MPKQPRALEPLLRPQLRALAGEILGAGIEIDPAPGHPKPVVGTLVDETLSTFVVRVPEEERLRRFGKAGLTGTLSLSSEELPLRGDLLRVRPEDRTKRLLVGGPRRNR